MKIILYIVVSFVGLVIGGLLGYLGGAGFAWLAALGYERGPTDSSVAPTSFTMFVMYAGFLLGALIGFAFGFGLCARFLKPSGKNPS